MIHETNGWLPVSSLPFSPLFDLREPVLAARRKESRCVEEQLPRDRPSKWHH